MSRRSVVFLVCGLLATCVFALFAYRYLLSSSSEAEVEHRYQKVFQKQAIMSTPKLSNSSSSTPAGVLSKAKDVSVEEKSATFSVDGQVMVTICCYADNNFCYFVVF